VSRIAPKPGTYPAPQSDARGDIVSHTLRRVTDSPLDRAVADARDALVARQDAQGHWLFELEADCTIPAEYIMMMHFLDEIDAELETKICRYLRSAQAEHGGWPLYHGGAFNISCTVKAYYALKLAGDRPDAAHMVRARTAILEHGGAAAVNVFTRIALALYGQLPWRGVPYIPVEIMLLPRWFPFHLDKVSYWSRTVMVPLFILCTRKPVAKNPRNVHIRELFTTPPETERDYFRTEGILAKAFLVADRLGRMIDPLIPARMRERATRLAENWMLERLNGEDGLGAIFPAMVNSLEAMVILGYAEDDPRRVTAKRALQKLTVVACNVAEVPIAQTHCALSNGVEDRLDIGRRSADHPQDLARRGLLFLQLHEARLEVVDPGALALPRVAGDRGLGFDLRPRGLCTPTHRPLLASHGALRPRRDRRQARRRRPPGQVGWPGTR